MVLETINEIRAALNAANTSLNKLETQLKTKPLPELAVSIVDNSDYDDDLIAAMKSYIDVIAKSDIRRVLIFQNYWQMVDDKFPQYVIDSGLQVDFDTMQSVFRTTTPAQQVKYMQAAEKYSPRGFHIDDSHNHKPEELKTFVDFMRDYTDAPIYASMAADDSRLPVKQIIKNPTTGEQLVVRYTTQDYVNAGLLITRQFFRHEKARGKTPEARTGIVDTWLKSGRITHGINLEAFKAGTVTTSPQDFELMLAKCLNAGYEFLSVYAAVNSPKWLMWRNAPALWQAVNAGAVTVRLWKQ